jgi:hypothetical protein
MHDTFNFQQYFKYIVDVNFIDKLYYDQFSIPIDVILARQDKTDPAGLGETNNLFSLALLVKLRFVSLGHR